MCGQALGLLNCMQPLKIGVKLKRKSKPPEVTTATTTRKKGRGCMYVCDTSSSDEDEVEDEEKECMYDTSDFEVTIRTGPDNPDCVDGHSTGFFDGFRIPIIKKEGNNILCNICNVCMYVWQCIYFYRNYVYMYVSNMCTACMYVRLCICFHLIV